MTGQKTPPYGNPAVQAPVAGTINSPHPLPGMPPILGAPPVPSPPNVVGMSGQMPLVPPQFQPGHTAQIKMPLPAPQQAMQWHDNSQQQEETPPKKWGPWIAVVAIIAVLIGVLGAVFIGSSSNATSASTKVPKVGKGSGSKEAPPPPPAVEAAPAPQIVPPPAPAVVPPPAPADEEEAPSDEAGTGCEPCDEQEELPPPLTLEGVATDLEQFKQSQKGQWDSIGKLNKQMKEVKEDIAAIRLDVNEIKKLDAMKTSDLPGMPASTDQVADAKQTTTVKITTVEHDGPPPQTPRPAKVRRK